MALTKAKSGVVDPTVLDVITSVTAGSAAPAVGDEFAGYDISNTAARKFTLEEFFRGIVSLTGLSAAPAAADAIPVYDDDGVVSRKITVTELFAAINNLTADGSPNQAADYVATFDASGSTSKKVLLQNIGVFSESYTSSNQTISNAGSLTLPHGLSTTPALIQCKLECLTSEHNYSIGDQVLANMGAENANLCASIVPDATNINIRFAAVANPYNVINKTTGALNGATSANWALIAKAWA